jgi:hypothetical protein
MAFEIAQAGAQPKDGLWFLFDFGGLQPLESIVVRAVQPKALDMLVSICMLG